MPVKNVKRKTNDGFEGVITGLNDKEKEIISNSVGIEANPADEATETLEKLKVSNVTYNVGGGSGGAEYTAGKNITISEAKEISVPDDIASVNSIGFYHSTKGAPISIFQEGERQLTIKNSDLNYFPNSINFYSGWYMSYKSLTIYFPIVSSNDNYSISHLFPSGGSRNFYVHLSRAKIPDVPTDDGTYVLKATVSSGSLTYSWVKEGE